MENKIRNTLNEIYFGKTKDIVNGLRSVENLSLQKEQKDINVALQEVFKHRNAKPDSKPDN